MESTVNICLFKKIIFIRSKTKKNSGPANQIEIKISKANKFDSLILCPQIYLFRGEEPDLAKKKESGTLNPKLRFKKILLNE